jgi:hypothetical protein
MSPPCDPLESALLVGLLDKFRIPKLSVHHNISKNQTPFTAVVVLKKAPKKRYTTFENQS